MKQSKVLNDDLKPQRKKTTMTTMQNISLLCIISERNDLFKHAFVS